MRQTIFDRKHLSTSQRLLIEKGLNDGLSFAGIARHIQKHPSTIAKEVYKYRVFQKQIIVKAAKKCASFHSTVSASFRKVPATPFRDAGNTSR